MADNDNRLLKINDRQVNAATAIDGKRTEYRIERTPGLVLRVEPSGKASWYFVYYVWFGKVRKSRKMRLSSREGIDLAEVRRKALALHQVVEAGGDPVMDEKERVEAMTFREMAESFLASGKLKESTQAVYRYGFEAHVFPLIGDLPAGDVTADHVLRICRELELAGTKVQSERTRASIGGVFRWGVKERYVKFNPTAGLGSRLDQKVSRDRTPTDDEISQLWHAAAHPQQRVSPIVRDIIRLVVLTGVRRNEAAGARLDEFRGLDGDRPIWTIQGDRTERGQVIRGRMKNGESHTVFLSPQAADLVQSAIKEHGDQVREYLFPAHKKTVAVGRAPRTPHINAQSVTTAMLRMRTAGAIADITVHDLRRAIGAWMKERGYRKEIRDVVLAHKNHSVDEIYSSGANMENPVREAMCLWAEHVWAITGQGSNVVSLETMRA